MTIRLDRAPLGRHFRISHIHWDNLSAEEGRRLREFGLDDGVTVTPLHRGSIFSRDPLALTIGRMKVIIRANQAAAIEVEPLA